MRVDERDHDETHDGGGFGVGVVVKWSLLGALLVVVVGIFGTDLLQRHALQQRILMSEVRSNLKAVYTAQRAYFMELDTHAADIASVGFRPERGNRYAYFFASQGPLHARATEADGPVHAGTVVIGADTHRHPRGFVPSRFADTKCPVTPMRDPDGRLLDTPGVTPGPRGGFLAAAAGHLDDDETLDCWTIASAERTAADGTRIPAGEPWNELDDLER